MQRVTSESVMADGHSPSNLVSMTTNARGKGFRVERYVRPPVLVEVALAVPVTVTCILLSPDLPPQTEMRFDVSVCSDRNSEEWQVCQGEVSGSADGEVSGSADTEVVVVMRSPRLWSGAAERSSLLPGPVLGSYAATLHRARVHECRLRTCSALTKCRQVRVKISRWTGIRPVTLKWLEVWGHLAKTCSREDSKRYQNGCRTWRAAITTGGSSPSLQYFQSSECSSSMQHNTGLINHKEEGGLGRVCGKVHADLTGEVAADAGKTEPAQLLDEITFEVMEMPMVLPSGRCVDQSTLDKLAQADTACGRPPTDPFTGNLYCGTDKETCRHARPSTTAPIQSMLQQMLESMLVLVETLILAEDRACSNRCFSPC